MFGIVAFEDVDVFHDAAPLAREVRLAEARLRPAGYDAAAFACFATMGHGVACRGPSSPFGLRRGSLRYDRACRAVACEASEGWWSQAGDHQAQVFTIKIRALAA